MREAFWVALLGKQNEKKDPLFFIAFNHLHFLVLLVSLFFLLSSLLFLFCFFNEFLPFCFILFLRDFQLLLWDIPLLLNGNLSVEITSPLAVSFPVMLIVLIREEKKSWEGTEKETSYIWHLFLFLSLVLSAVLLLLLWGKEIHMRSLAPLLWLSFFLHTYHFHVKYWQWWIWQ